MYEQHIRSVCALPQLKLVSGRVQVGNTLSGSMFMPWYLRCFGARVGRNVYYDAQVPAEARTTRVFILNDAITCSAKL